MLKKLEIFSLFCFSFNFGLPSSSFSLLILLNDGVCSKWCIDMAVLIMICLKVLLCVYGLQIFRLGPVQSVCMVEGSDAGKQVQLHHLVLLPQLRLFYFVGIGKLENLWILFLFLDLKI